MEIQIRESQIEDVLATYPHIAQRLLRYPQQLRLIARQMGLPSGRLDLLFSAGPRLLLLELKIEPFQRDFVSQTKAYAQDLVQMQKDGGLIEAPLEAMLLCPRFTASQEQSCRAEGVTPIAYSPDQVLQSFYNEFSSLSAFVLLRPSDQGLWNIHLAHRVLYSLPLHRSIASFASETGLSPKTVANHLRFAEELRLVRRDDRQYLLTETGERYVAARNPDYPPEFLSERQSQVLRDLIVKDPFATPAIFGIYSMVDAVFALSRNGYPVPWDTLVSYFREVSGKRFEWSADKTAYHGTRMYSNYAADLGLLGRVGHNLYLTPDGLRFILLLQLHKSIKMIDALGISLGR